MASSKLKIGIDFHGVITANPIFFKKFTHLAQRKGYLIYVISGGPRQKVKSFLDENQIHYYDIFSLVDYFSELGEVRYSADGSFEVDKQLWNSAKAKYCYDNGIDIQIDDSPEYGISFSTPFCHYNPEQKVCEVDGYKIEFSNSPENSLNSIENYIQRKYKK